MDLDSPINIRASDCLSYIGYESDPSEVTNSAFLEAIRVHPLSQALLLSGTEHRDLTRVKHIESIQNFILERTGKFLTNEDIQGRVINAFPAEKIELYYNKNEVYGFPNDSYQRNLPPQNLSELEVPPQSHGPIEPKNTSFFRSVDVDHPSLLPAVQVNNSSSMSRRREASNRPTLKLHVEMPPQTFNGSHPRSLLSPTNSKQRSATSGSTNITPSWFRVSMMGSTLSENAFPITPADKRIMTPIAPPEISRTMNIRRNAINYRWAPTPTEVVPPSLSYMTFDVSPTMGSDSHIPAPMQMLHSFNQDFSIYNANVPVSNNTLDDSPRSESDNALASPLILSK